MSHQISLTERLSRALATPSAGVLGLVDELLAVSREHDLQFTWQAGRCHIRFLEGGAIARIEAPLQKSIVRAVLARVAVLCNERNPNSVTPYGGQGEVSVSTDPATAIRVRFVNTPEEQTLELTSAGLGAPEREGEQLLADTIEESGAFPRNDVVGKW
jgi:hypothetical protein